MSTPKKPTAREELERLEDALLESLLNAPGQELRDEIAAAGIDPDACIAEVDATITEARAACARKRLEEARAEFAAWRKRNARPDVTALDVARAKLDRIRSGDRQLNEKMMLAARKGEGLSESDIEALLEDLAALEKLEREDGNE